MRISSWSALVLVVGTAMAFSSASLAGVFLNGVNIDGVTGQTFENCTVTIDDKGNVLITAKGYEVQAPPPAGAQSSAVPPEPVTRRYFLVSEQSVVGMAQYDVDVYVNSQWVKRVASSDPQIVVELTKYLRKGRNVVHFTATKNTKEPRRSTANEHVMRIHIGEGNVGGNNVMLDPSLVQYERTAAETQNFDDDFVLVGR